jgi:hypothetical protein
MHALRKLDFSMDEFSSPSLFSIVDGDDTVRQVQTHVEGLCSGSESQGLLALSLAGFRQNQVRVFQWS